MSLAASDGRDSSRDSAVRTDAEKLGCYRVAREMHTLVLALLPSVGRVVRDQLERASLSAVLNCAEGAGRRSPRDKAHFYSIARGSANETVALLDVTAAQPELAVVAREARVLAVRVIQMLARLEARFR